jgi:hypothetical protein
MCIFNTDVVVNSTQIFSTILPNKKHLLAYANNVTAPKGGAVMMLPIPTNQKITFHDSSEYSQFLNDLSKFFANAWTKGLRGGKDISIEQCGMYEICTANGSDLVDVLIGWEQAVPEWIYKMIDAYSEYSWIIVKIPEGHSMQHQPLLLEYVNNIDPEQIYIPLMDIHGNGQIKRVVDRNAIVIIGDKDGFDTGVKVPWGNIKYSALNYGFIGQKYFKNGDLWISHDGNTHWTADFKTPYVFED